MVELGEGFSRASSEGGGGRGERVVGLERWRWCLKGGELGGGWLAVGGKGDGVAGFTRKEGG